MIKISTMFLFLTICGGVAIASDERVLPAVGESLYLHCFRATWGQQVILDPSDIKDSTPATPPTALLTLKVVIGSDFDVSVGERMRGYWLEGKTFLDGKRLMACFNGSFGSSRHAFSGPIELEEVFDPNEVAFFSMIMPFRCVFSRHKEMKPFLDAQALLDEKRLAEATESSRKNIEIQKSKAEQGGAGQPATRPESKPEGDDKPQPEAEGRSR